MDKGQGLTKCLIGWAVIAFSLFFVYFYLFFEFTPQSKEIETVFYEVSVALFALLLYLETKLIRFAILTIILIHNLTGDLIVIVPEMNIGITVAAWSAIMFFTYKILIQWKKQHRRSSVVESGLV